MNKTDLVIYDFCGTLVDFQTANAYVNFVVSEKGLPKRGIDYARIALNKLHLIPFLNRFFKHKYINKAMILYRLKGYSYNEMDFYAKEFYNMRIKGHLIRPVVERLKQDIAIGKTVAIVSGGYDIYLKYFASEVGVTNLLCSSLSFINGIFSGRIDGIDCMGDNKVTRLSAYFNEIDLSNLFENVTVYSDSDSDLPLFQISNKRIVVSKSNEIPAWANKIGAEVLIYSSSK